MQFSKSSYLSSHKNAIHFKFYHLTKFHVVCISLMPLRPE